MNGLGVPQDYAQAAVWLRKAADQGDAHAQHNLGMIYARGLGVPQDYALAFVWYRKAAEQGTAEAQGALGAMYDQGWGVRQDYVHALMWLSLAAEQGSETAKKGRDEVTAKMTPVQIAEAERMAGEWMQSHLSKR